MPYKIDLHTHSQASPDGALQAADYRQTLTAGRLDYIAVTDHDRIDFARQLQIELGPQIIVGEEISTREGEIIGLYLTEAIPAGLSAADTIRHIRRQGGLVYIPHPFETVRKGVTLKTLDTIAAEVDILETYNGRTLQNRGVRAEQWAGARQTDSHQIGRAHSSDAHGRTGWGNTYSVITEVPTRENLVKLLTMSTGSHGSVGIRGRLYPKLNRLRKHFHAG